MGLRTAVLVACAITWFLVSFPKPGVTTNTFVDNIRFAGPTEGVIDATLMFVERCKAIGATLDNMPSTRDEARALIEESGDFLGVHFDYKQSLMSLTKKTRTKIEMIDAANLCKSQVSFRQLSVIMGVFNYSARVLRFPLYRAFHLLRRFREESALEALFPQTVWGEREILLAPGELQELKEMQESPSAPFHRRMLPSSLTPVNYVNLALRRDGGGGWPLAGGGLDSWFAPCVDVWIGALYHYCVVQIFVCEPAKLYKPVVMSVTVSLYLVYTDVKVGVRTSGV